jgi:hypothetical protein
MRLTRALGRLIGSGPETIILKLEHIVEDFDCRDS